MTPEQLRQRRRERKIVKPPYYVDRIRLGCRLAISEEYRQWEKEANRQEELQREEMELVADVQRAKGFAAVSWRGGLWQVATALSELGSAEQALETFRKINSRG